MGNTCVGPSISKNGIIQSFSAAIGRSQSPEASISNRESVNEATTNEPETPLPVQNKPLEQITMPKPETNQEEKSESEPKKGLMRMRWLFMHRDLKPKNFLFVNQQEDSLLKTIDFGLSVFFKPGYARLYLNISNIRPKLRGHASVPDFEDEDNNTDEQKLIRTGPRIDSFDVEALDVPCAHRNDYEDISAGKKIVLAFQTLGVVFGDVGTSPLYTFSVMFRKAPINGNEDILGALSLVLYT